MAFIRYIHFLCFTCKIKTASIFILAVIFALSQVHVIIHSACWRCYWFQGKAEFTDFWFSREVFIEISWYVPSLLLDCPSSYSYFSPVGAVVTRANSYQSDSSGFLEEPSEPSPLQVNELMILFHEICEKFALLAKLVPTLPLLPSKKSTKWKKHRVYEKNSSILDTISLRFLVKTRELDVGKKKKKKSSQWSIMQGQKLDVNLIQSNLMSLTLLHL